ncbi:MAG TPA: GtrA family protein [Salinarimonas sp.]|nr:GtrA family protein [Salinarimonas sp.]
MVAIRYVLFAVISTVANLLVQEMVTRAVPWATLLPGLLAGTVTGFVVKYVLDKRYIFNDAYSTAGAEARKVSLSALFSILTTLVFWGFEISFWLIWGTDLAKYSGAVLGISIGYVIKYALDRRFVFVPDPGLRTG